jgi:hypothetical protein
MAQVTFTIANGILEVADGGGMYSYHSADYRAKSVWNSTRLRIVVYPILHELTPATRREWEADEVTQFILNGVIYGTVEGFVTNFNQIAGTNIGFNTKYPENLFSQHIELDTSVPLQVVPAWCITGHNAGYVILTAPSTNSGNVYIGEDDVSNESYALEPDRSITIEISDLSLIWAMNDTSGDHLGVIGVAKT